MFLLPKDPDPYPAFSIRRISEETGMIHFFKNSAGEYLPIELQKVAEIMEAPTENAVYIRLLGRVVWNAAIPCWQFVPRSLAHPKNEGAGV